MRGVTGDRPRQQNLMRRAFASDSAEAKAFRSKIKGVFVESVSVETRRRGDGRGGAPGPARSRKRHRRLRGGVDATGMDLRGADDVAGSTEHALARARGGERGDGVEGGRIRS